MEVDPGLLTLVAYPEVSVDIAAFDGYHAVAGRTRYSLIKISGWPKLDDLCVQDVYNVDLAGYRFNNLMVLVQANDSARGLVSTCCYRSFEKIESLQCRVTRVPVPSPLTPKSQTSPFWRRLINWLWKHLRFS